MLLVHQPLMGVRTNVDEIRWHRIRMCHPNTVESPWACMSSTVDQTQVTFTVTCVLISRILVDVPLSPVVPSNPNLDT